MSLHLLPSSNRYSANHQRDWTVGEITQATLDMGAKTLTVTGTTAQLAMVSWMFATMDQPAPANQATQQYLPAGTVDDVVRILYLSHPRTAQSFQEFVN